MDGQYHALATLPRGKPGTHCTESWERIVAGLDGMINLAPHRDSITKPSILYSRYPGRLCTSVEVARAVVLGDLAKVSFETLVTEIKLRSLERSLAVPKLTQTQKLCAEKGRKYD